MFGKDPYSMLLNYLLAKLKDNGTMAKNHRFMKFGKTVTFQFMHFIHIHILREHPKRMSDFWVGRYVKENRT